MSSRAPCLFFSIHTNIKKCDHLKHFSKLIWKIWYFSLTLCTPIIHFGLLPLNLSHNYKIIVKLIRFTIHYYPAIIPAEPGSITKVNYRRWINFDTHSSTKMAQSRCCVVDILHLVCSISHFLISDILMHVHLFHYKNHQEA